MFMTVNATNLVTVLIQKQFILFRVSQGSNILLRRNCRSKTGTQQNLPDLITHFIMHHVIIFHSINKTNAT